MHMRSGLLIVVSTLMLSTSAFAQSAKIAETSKGKALVDSKGMTLYVFDKDNAGKSNCNGQCAVNWPPLPATASDKPSGDWSIVTRDDGNGQWAYKGKPVYTWTKDTKPGDTGGDGLIGAWHIATP